MKLRTPSNCKPLLRLLAGLVAAVMAHASAAQGSAEAATPHMAERSLAALPKLLGLPPLLSLTSPTASAASGAASARPAAGTANIESLALERAARLGLASSPDVRVAAMRAESFAHTEDAARGALLPRVDVRLATGRGRLESVQPNEFTERKDALVTLRQPLLDEPSRAEWSRQSLLARSARLQVEQARSEALLEAGGAYLAALQSGIGLQLGAEYEALLGELNRYIAERASAGGASPADRDRVRARVANLRAGLAEARASLASSLRQLQRLTGEAPPALSMASDASLEVAADAAAALAQARAHNAELAAARIEREAAGAERRAMLGRFGPRFELELSHQRSLNSGGTPGYQRDSRAMVVMTLPLVNGGTDLAQVRSASARERELDARIEALERRLSQEIETAYANLDASRARFEAVRDEVQNNRNVVEAFRAQMVGGNRPLLDMLDAYQRLHQSRIDLTRVIISIAQNEWQVSHLTGALPRSLGAPDSPNAEVAGASTPAGER